MSITAGTTLCTRDTGADIEVTELDENSVRLHIEDMWFYAEDLKELGKFLKKLQKQLEAGNQEGGQD